MLQRSWGCNLRFNHFLIFIVLATQLNCSFKQKGRNQQPAQNQADFIVDKLKFEQSAQVQQKSADGFLLKRLFNITYCLRDRITAEPIVDESFTIGIEQYRESLSTDHRGCAVFNYAITYNQYQNALYVEIPYQIARDSSGSPYEGRMAINPWIPDLADLRYKPIADLYPISMSGMGFQGLKGDNYYIGRPSRITMDSLRIKTISKNLASNPATYTMDIFFTPEVIQTDPDNNPKRSRLNGGQFELDMAVVATRPDQTRYVIAQAEARVSAIVLEQKLYFEGITLLQYDVPSTNDTVDIYMQINPASAEMGIDTYEIKGSFTGKTFEGESMLGVTSLVEEKFATYKMPIQDIESNLTGPSLLVQSFSYEYPPQEVDALVSANLRLTINESMYVILNSAIAVPEEIGRSRMGENENIPLKPGQTVKARLAVLARDTTVPAEEPNDSTPFRRLRYISGYEATITVNKNGQLVIPLIYAFDFEERPKLESGTRLLLELIPEFTYLDARVRPVRVDVMFDFLSDRGSSQVIRYGSFDSLAEVTATMVPYPYRLAAQEISAIKKEEMATDQGVKDMVFYKPRIKSEFNARDSYLKIMNEHSKLQFIDADGGDIPALAAPAAASLKKALASIESSPILGADVLAPLCDLYGTNRLWSDGRNPSDIISQCKASPSKFVSLKSTYFVDKVTSRPVKLGQENTNINIATGLSVGESSSNDWSSGWGTSVSSSASVTASGGLDLLGNGVKGNVSVGVGADLYWRSGSSESSRSSRDLSVGTSKPLTVEEHIFKFDVEGSSCLVAEPAQDDRNACFFATGCDTAYKPVMACRKTTFAAQESWFFLADSIVYRLSTGRNNRELANRKWLTLIRGKTAFTAFAQSLEDSVSPVYLERQSIMDLRFNSLLKDFLGNQVYRYGIIQDPGVGDFPGLIR